jgi:hypothetical protein
VAQAGLDFLAISYYGQFQMADMYPLLLAAAINGGMSTLLCGRAGTPGVRTSKRSSSRVAPPDGRTRG